MRGWRPPHLLRQRSRTAEEGSGRGPIPGGDAGHRAAGVPGRDGADLQHRPGGADPAPGHPLPGPAIRGPPQRQQPQGAGARGGGGHRRARGPGAGHPRVRRGVAGPPVLEHLPPASALLAAHAPLLDDPLQVLTDPAGWVQGWLWAAIFGKDQVAQQGWLGDLFSRAFYFTGLDAGTCSAPGGGTCSTFSIWSALQTSGYLVLAMALMFRLFKVLFDPAKQVGIGQWLVSDVVIRGSLGVAAINVSYAVLAMLMHSSIVVGDALFENIMSVTMANFAGQTGLKAAISEILSPANLPIPLILETLVVLYLTALLLASRVAIIFAIAVAPLVLPLYAYSGQNSLIVWWLKLVAQGLLVPIVMGALFAVALVVIQAVNSLQAGLVTPLLGTVTAVVSLWFVGHAIHQLLRYLYPGHSGFLAGAVVVRSRASFIGSQVRGAGRTVLGPVLALRRQ